jgi:predicted phage tail protein
MTKVHLLGKLGDKFGKEFNLDVKHTKQLIRAIAVQRKGFLNFFFDEQEKGIEYAFKKGKEFLKVGEESLSFGSEDVFIMAVPQGSVSDGFKRDLGALLTVIGTILVFFPDPFAKAIGTAMIIVGGYLMFDGIMGLIADDSPPEDVEAAVFGGPINVAKQGIPIPLCYGKMEVSGAPVNFGFTTRRIQQNTGWVNINDPDQEGSGDYGSGIGGGTGGSTAAQKIN